MGKWKLVYEEDKSPFGGMAEEYYKKCGILLNRKIEEKDGKIQLYLDESELTVIKGIKDNLFLYENGKTYWERLGLNFFIRFFR